jgi:hypothetical protein
MRSNRCFLLVSLTLLACGEVKPRREEPAEGVSENEAKPSKAKNCASAFGDALTNSFGRIDGVVQAIVTPTDQQCAMPNSDHVIVQVRMNDAVYRLVVNVQSDGSDAQVRYGERTGPKLTKPWEEGWHPGEKLDYAADLGVHSDDALFEPYPMTDLVKKVSDAITVGARISVYATSTGGSYAHSAHKIHRNKRSDDGALVLSPTDKSPRWLLFRFGDQSF